MNKTYKTVHVTKEEKQVIRRFFDDKNFFGIPESAFSAEEMNTLNGLGEKGLVCFEEHEEDDDGIREENDWWLTDAGMQVAVHMIRKQMAAYEAKEAANGKD